MAIRLHASIAAALLCGAVGFAGPSFAQATAPIGAPAIAPIDGATAPVGGAPAVNPALPGSPAGVIPEIKPVIPDATTPVPPPIPGPEAVGPAPQIPDVTQPGLDAVPGANAATTPETGLQPQITAEPTDTIQQRAATVGTPEQDQSANGLFGLDLQNTSTKVAGLSRAKKATVERNERRVTSELNRASAASTGNANPTTRASVPNDVTTQ